MLFLRQFCKTDEDESSLEAHFVFQTHCACVYTLITLYPEWWRRRRQRRMIKERDETERKGKEEWRIKVNKQSTATSAVKKTV